MSISRQDAHACQKQRQVRPLRLNPLSINRKGADRRELHWRSRRYVIHMRKLELGLPHQLNNTSRAKTHARISHDGNMQRRAEKNCDEQVTGCFRRCGAAKPMRPLQSGSQARSVSKARRNRPKQKMQLIGFSFFLLFFSDATQGPCRAPGPKSESKSP